MMDAKQQCNFFLLRYVPDAVKNEFVNVGLVLLPQSGAPELRFTRDWSRVKCLDAEADLELLQALESDLRRQLEIDDGGRDSILRRIQDSFSNALQPSEAKACLADSPKAEADELARIYLERERRRATREPSRRLAILDHMRREFEIAGVWDAMRHEIRAAQYTRAGDPLRIDCGYESRTEKTGTTVKMFHAMSLAGDPNAAKLLAFSFPALAAGIRKAEGSRAELTAIVEDEPASGENAEAAAFARETLEQNAIHVAPLGKMPGIAARAAREMGFM